MTILKIWTKQCFLTSGQSLTGTCIYIHRHPPNDMIFRSIYVGVYLYIYVKLAILVVGDPKAPFSIAPTLKCRGGCNSIPLIAPLYPWSLPYNA